MSSDRPRALLIAPTMPAESGNGLAMRVGMFLEALAQAADVDLVVLPISGSGDRPSPLVERLGVAIHVVPVTGRADTRFVLLSQIADRAARLDAFRAYGRGSRHALLSRPVLDELRRWASGRDYALIHLERLYLLEAGLAAGGRRLSVDLDEDDAWAWRKAAQLEGDRDRARWMQAEAAAEDRLLRRIPAGSTAFVSSPLDRRRLQRRISGLVPAVVPNAVVIPTQLARSDDGQTLLFVGAFGYAPNVEGMRWFAHDIWPRVREARPGARLLIVGPDMPAVIRDLSRLPGIEPLGRVGDITAVYSRTTLAIAPLRAGGGTRIKLIEAAAYGVPIIATRLAAQGLGLTGRSAWLADTPSDFAAAIEAALRDPGERQQRAVRARLWAQRRHNRDIERAKLACRFEEMLAQ
jgi:glycosyltransferase involved in cell wall biosynthesis